MQWTLIVYITNAICFAPRARAQYGVPVPVYAMPPPVMPVLVPVPIMQHPSAATTSTTTTTTTTPRSVAVPVPVPVPVPVGMPYPINAMPAFPPPVSCQAKSRPPKCPPCPPCVCTPMCTPAFFSYCSPCHQKCRCKDPAEAPLPPPVPAIPMPMPRPVPALPMPMPAPPPVVVMPFAPSIRFPKLPKVKRDPCVSSGDSDDITTDESSSYESSEASDSDIYYKKARKRKRRRKRIFSRRNKKVLSSDSEVVKPVLTYISKNGDIKFKKKISNAEATRLLDKNSDKKEKERVEKVHWLPEGESSDLAQNRRQIVIKTDKAKAKAKGNKHVVFRPPANKKISNLTVSFQVTE